MPNWAGTLIEPHEGGRAAQGDADECGEGPVQDGTIKVLQLPYIFEFT